MNIIIYKVTNIINNKVYIGQTITELDKRIYYHYQSAFKNNTQSPFYCAIRKYGWDNFTWVIIFNLDDTNKYEIDMLERFWIAYYRKKLGRENVYNITDGGSGTIGYKFTDERKENHSKILKGKNTWTKGRKQTQEFKDKISKKMKNRIFTPIWRQRISEGLKGIHKSPHSEEHKLKQSLAMRGKKPYEMTNEIKQNIKMALINYYDKNKSPFAKFTDEQIKDIKIRLLNNESIISITKIYNVSRHAIYDIKNNKTKAYRNISK